MRIFGTFLLLVATSAFARPQWPDLEVGQEFKLTQEFVFPNNFLVKNQEAITVTDMNDLGIGVVLFEVTQRDCATPETELEVEIFTVPTEIGLAVEPNCVLWFFVEYRDLYTEAPLE